MSCKVCLVNPASVVCGACLATPYCSKACQRKDYQQHVTLVCGKTEKRTYVGIDEFKAASSEDEALKIYATYNEEEREACYVYMLEQGSSTNVEFMERLYKDLSDMARWRHEKEHPCHNETDPITLDDLSTLKEEDKLYLIMGTHVKMCYYIDSIYSYVVQGGNTKEVVTQRQLSPQQLQYIEERGESTKRRLLEALTEPIRLVQSYGVGPLELPWDTMVAMGTVPPLNLDMYVEIFHNVNLIREALVTFPTLKNLLDNNVAFWRLFFKDRGSRDMDVLQKARDIQRADYLELYLRYMNEPAIRVEITPNTSYIHIYEQVPLPDDGGGNNTYYKVDWYVNDESDYLDGIQFFRGEPNYWVNYEALMERQDIYKLTAHVTTIEHEPVEINVQLQVTIHGNNMSHAGTPSKLLFTNVDTTSLSGADIAHEIRQELFYLEGLKSGGLPLVEGFAVYVVRFYNNDGSVGGQVDSQHMFVFGTLENLDIANSFRESGDVLHVDLDMYYYPPQVFIQGHTFGADVIYLYTTEQIEDAKLTQCLTTDKSNMVITNSDTGVELLRYKSRKGKRLGRLEILDVLFKRVFVAQMQPENIEINFY